MGRAHGFRTTAWLIRRAGGSLGPAGRGPSSDLRVIRLRQVINWVNLSTPLGLTVALAGRCRISRGPHGVVIASGYRWPVPPVKGRAITIGDVVLLGLSDEQLARRPALLTHEARHSGQYARWLGPIGFLPAYALASAWSWWVTGDAALRNHFESRAGLVDGGYASGPPEPPAEV